MVSPKRGHLGTLVVILVTLLVIAQAVIGCGNSVAPQSGAPPAGAQPKPAAEQAPAGGQQPQAAPTAQAQGNVAPSGQAAQSAKSVKVGVIQPMSGGLSAYGQETQAALEYVVKKINDEGGIKSLGGAKIELVLADDASDAARSADEARRLITQENVALLTGSLLSAQMGAVSPVADQYKMPTLSFWAGGTRSQHLYTMGYPYDRGYAATMVNYIDWLKKSKGVKIQNVALVSSNYEAGQQVDKFAQPRLKDLGYNVVGQVPLDQNVQDHTPAILRVRSLKPDAVMGLVTVRDGVLLDRARYSANYHDPIFVGGTGGYSDPVLWKELGKDVAKATLTRNFFGMTGVASGVPMPSLQDFMKEFKAANLPVPMGQNVIQGAQAARVIQAVLEQAGSSDREKIGESLKAVKIPFGSPNLYLPREGGLAFGDDRMLTDSTALIIQWAEDESQQVVWPGKFAEKEPRLTPK